MTRKIRDLLHIAGMGSSLGVGFNPGSPDTMIPDLIIMEIRLYPKAKKLKNIRNWKGLKL